MGRDDVVPAIRRWWPVALLAVGACLGYLQWAGRARADTPREFVQKYVEAWQAKDGAAILAMEAELDTLARAGVRDDLRAPVEAYTREQRREELERELDRGGMWYQAWCATRFVDSRMHKDHIHVDVEVRGARSEIVLVRRDGVLKVHPRPSWFD